MALTLADILFFWDHGAGLVTPTIGGQPTFTRAGNAYSRQPEGLHLQLPTNTPRFEPDGLRIEPAQTNQLSDPFEIIDTATGWSDVASRLTESTVTSIFDGESATLGRNAGAVVNARWTQTVGTWTSGQSETAVAIIENVDSATSALWFWDATASDSVGRVTYTWASDTVASEHETVGTMNSYGAFTLMEVGPNGGKVVVIWGNVTPDNNGNTRAIDIQPMTAAADTSAIAHAAMLVEADIFTSMADGSRVAEALTWNNPPKPQALVVYGAFRTQNDLNNVTAGQAVYRISDIDDDSLGVQIASGGYVQSRLEVAATNAFLSTSHAPVSGDVVEFVQILNADTSTRMITRVNGGAVAAGAASSAGTMPTAWTTPSEFALAPGAGTALWHRTLKIVTQTNVQSALDGTGTGDENIMAEMAGLFVSPDGQRMYNVVI